MNPPIVEPRSMIRARVNPTKEALKDILLIQS
jgi:hypothetical protein